MTDQIPKHVDDKDPLLRVAYKFEYSVILVLVAAVGLITVLSIARLFFGVYDAIFVTWDPKNYHAVQVLFGMVMTVLIAMEFGNSILRHIRENSTIIQAREVILIGMMAVVRKIMIIDLSVAATWHIAALGLVAASLACAFWLMQDS